MFTLGGRNRHKPRLRRRPKGDGFTLLELVAAISILAIVIGAFGASIALGFRTVALARQRQTAADLATARLEHLRSIPYGQIAVSPAPTHQADPTNPDYFVSADATTYDVDGEGTIEPLVLDEAAGGVLHLEDPVQVGSTIMEIYQYVTWVDDVAITGTQDYKRVTVVVRYKAPSVHGVNRIVRASSFFGFGTVTIGGTTTTVPGATVPTTTTVPETTTTVPDACPGDTSAPVGSFTLNGTASAEAGYTAGANVTINLSFADLCAPITARISNEVGDPGSWFEYDSANPTVSWALSASDGTKAVNIEVSDVAGNSVITSDASIILDSTIPTSPGELGRAVSCASSERTATLSWGLAADSNLRGYRIYRSTDGATWSVLSTTTALSVSDTHSKSLDSVRYYAVAYDKAGNESAATNLVSLNKNKCS